MDRRSTLSHGKQKHIDPLEQAMEAALSPGNFISYKASWSFVDDVQNVVNDIEKIIKKEPERAAHLFDIFIAACHEKADEIDDSSGNFGMLVDDLFRGWIKARQAGNDDPEQTAKSLLSWMEDDPYGYCYYLDREALKVLDKKGLDAFTRRIRFKFESVLSQDDKDNRFPGYAHRRWGGVLKTLLAGQRDVDAFIAFCERTEYETRDCQTIAKIYRRRRRPEDALSWVERGLEIARSDSRSSFEEHDLRELKRALLAKLGRPKDALQSAWSEFKANPSPFTYKELMRYVPAIEKMAWHQKAMEASERGDLSSQIELWFEKKENDRLVSRLYRATDEELENLSHYQTKLLAHKLQHTHPDISARVYRSLCMRIVNAGKSKYYDAALDNIKSAKKCYAKAGLNTEWQKLVNDLRKKHFRKKGFMAGFDCIVLSAPKDVQQPFMERVKARWPRKSGPRKTWEDGKRNDTKSGRS
jgi:tetratricopeptide (TPR) repeat protein